MKVSYSRIECFKKCPFQYKLRYVDKLKTLPDYDANNALIIGTALHTGIEKDVETAINWYYSQFPVITDLHVEEAIKLEAVIPKCKAMLPAGQHEVKLENNYFIGFIDLLVPVGDGVFDLYDFKYSNNIESYKESGQLHVYKYCFEEITGNKIRDMYFLFAPKVQIRLKKTETIDQFRRRLRDELDGKEPQLVKIPYDEGKFVEWLCGAVDSLSADDYKKNCTKLCDWCEYKQYCYEGVDYMILPKNERKISESANYKKIWLYGLPFSGKTYLANQFPDVLMLNTDGNIKFIDAPSIPIRDEVTVNGRLTERKYAWDIFKETITELEKKQNDFKTIVVDLLEDTYEHCRLYCYKKLGIEHESDNSFKAWDFIRTEFLSTIKRLMALDYNVILISHEDSSKDVTKKSGDKLTSIKPNIGDKIALKIAGMVDIVGRVINDEGKRTISFKANEVVFGGGRLNLQTLDIPCDYSQLVKIYGNFSTTVAKPVENSSAEPVSPAPVETATNEPVPTRRRRRQAEENIEVPEIG